MFKWSLPPRTDADALLPFHPAGMRPLPKKWLNTRQHQKQCRFSLWETYWSTRETENAELYWWLNTIAPQTGKVSKCEGNSSSGQCRLNFKSPQHSKPSRDSLRVSPRISPLKLNSLKVDPNSLFQFSAFIFLVRHPDERGVCRGKLFFTQFLCKK